MDNGAKYFITAIIMIMFFISDPIFCKAEDISDANNRFTFEMYQKLIQGKEDKNLFVSPFSVVSAMGMIYEGARGKTKEEMERVFHFPVDDKARREGF